ncbi:MAG: hypothetical protein AAF492_10795, partial [Verrucomicrobiota bacterium]
MLHESTTQMPGGEWIAEWRMRPSAWLSPKTEEPAIRFRTAKNQGEITLDVDRPEWGVKFKPALHLPPESVRLMANGFQISLDHIRRPGQLIAFIPASGVIYFLSHSDIHPTLASLGLDIQREEDSSALEGQNHATVLVRQETRFCLVTGHRDIDALRAEAREHLEADWEPLIAETWARQHKVLHGLDAGVSNPVGLHALETVHAHLRHPRGRMSHRWSASNFLTPEVMETNELLPLILVWLDSDSAVAMDLFRTVLSAQAEDGSIPPKLFPEEPPKEVLDDLDFQAWPLLAHCAYRIWEKTDDADFIRSVLPGLERYLSWAADYFIHHRTGLPNWRARREAFIGDIFEHDRGSVDLTAFLLAEFDAIRMLAERTGETLEHAELFADKGQHLNTLLEDFFWQPEAASYKDRFEDDAHVRWNGVNEIMPLHWSGLEMERQERLIEVLKTRNLLSTASGIPLWQPYRKERNLGAAPALQEIFLIDVLDRTDSGQTLERIAHELLTSMNHFFNSHFRFPTDLGFRSAIAHNMPLPAQAQDVTSALLVTQLLGAYRRGRIHPWSPPLVTFVTRHRALSLWLPILLLVVLLAGTATSWIMKPQPPEELIKSRLSVAHQYFLHKDYAGAIEIYEELRARGIERPALFRHLGKSYFAQRDFENA